MVGGGAEKVLIDMLNNFDYSRVDVELLLIWKEGVYLQDVPKGVKVKSVYSKPLSLREKINYNLFVKFGTLFGYKQSIRAKVLRKYDTIVSFLEGMSLKYHSYIVDRAKKNVSWVHTDLLNNHYTVGRLLSEQLEKQVYEKMDEIVFVSNDAKFQFEKLYTDNKTAKKVILNPINYDYISSYRKEYKCDNRCFNIVLVGRLESIKAYDRLIRLAKRLKEDNLIRIFVPLNGVFSGIIYNCVFC